MDAMTKIYMYYNNICDCIEKEKLELLNPEEMRYFPYISPTAMFKFRWQVMRCILQLRYLEEEVISEYLEHLDDDPLLCDITAKMEPTELQLMLIYFLNMNLCMDSISFKYRCLLLACQYNNKRYLTEFMNEFASRFDELEIPHQLPTFTPENLPTISLK